ncbi:MULTISPECIES: GntR family transcriptional regulator [Anaerotruncus]|uniref:GntR family transcriptional regulator n=1 Tax=Anaerotruncus TaxID=244127 RepID=UPI00082A5691|nr:MULTISPECIES: GntR family transcriptional regulator [Anaerotruncus]RGX55790.1 GntR family transcriptional regulator [Anaerotruncus sp. AF02-27]
MKKESLKLQAYNIIKEKIVNCEYAPNTLLNEEKLREEINASRTPIRDALSRLEQEGLIVILPKKGIMVSGLSISEVNMIFEVRMLVEPYALETYGRTLSDEVFLGFYSQFSNQQESPPDRYFELDDEFHHTIVGAMPNRFLLNTYEGIHTQNLRFRVMTGQEQAERIENTVSEHIAIAKACLKKDWALAAGELRRHLIQSKNATFDLLLKNQNFSIR